MTDWSRAERGELYQRMRTLECELRIASTILEDRESEGEKRGVGRSETVNELQTEWKALLTAKPTTKQEKAA